MSRRLTPWFREVRNAWYVEVGGKQVKLATGRENHREAMIALGRLLGGGGDDSPAPPKRVQSVGKLAALYLAEMRRRARDGEIKSSSVADAKRRLHGAESLGALAGLTPAKVNAWLAGRGLSSTSRADAVAALRAVLAFAVREGHTESDPLKGKLKTPRRSRRSAVLSPIQVEEAIALATPAEFRTFLLMLYATGARPSEVARMTAADFDASRLQVVLNKHKTDRHGRPRVIRLGWIAYFLVSRAAKERPAGGVLFPSSWGTPYTLWGLNTGIRRLRLATGLGKELTMYAFRHRFATDMLRSGAGLALTAAALGHSSTRMLEHYSHLEEAGEELRAAIDGRS